MATRKSLGLIGVGAVPGLVVAALVAVAVWPDDDSADEQPTTSRTDDADLATVAPPEVPAREDVDLPDLDLSAANRRSPVAGLPDWSRTPATGAASRCPPTAP